MNLCCISELSQKKNESIRRYFSSANRLTDGLFLSLQGMQVPKDWTIAYSIRDTHQLSTYFDDGDKFDPGRWEEDNRLPGTQADSHKSYHYLPFGSGSRACPAKEYARVLMKILIVELVRNCTWRLLNQTPKIKYLPVPHPEDNLPVEFSNAPAHRRRALTL